MKPVNGYIMEQHIIAALQKCGVHRKHGHRPLFGHPSRHRGRAALGDPHIKKAFGIGLRKGGQPGPPTMAAVRAQIRLSFRARRTSVRPNTREKFSPPDFLGAPVSGSKGDTP